MKATRVLIAAGMAGAFLLAGCGNNPLWSVVREREYGRVVGTPLRACLEPDEQPRDGYGAYGYVVLTRGPSPVEEARYERVCQAYLRHFQPLSEAEAKSDADLSSYMPVYWFLTADGVCNGDCTQLLMNYDYTRASLFASGAIGRFAKGPTLVALQKPYSRHPNQKNALVLDLSRFREQDLDRAFEIWRGRISTGPRYWNRGFRLEMAREEFRKRIIAWEDAFLQILELRGD